MAITIRLLALTVLTMCTPYADATGLPGSDDSVFKVVRLYAIGEDVVEVEVNRDFLVPQEIRRHYQTKSYISEYMLSRVKCKNRQLNVITYSWYAETGLSGELIYSSDRETGWYAADKDPAVQALVAKMCD